MFDTSIPKPPAAKMGTLKIERLPRGGYVVSTNAGQAYMQEALFASADIDDALGFIKDELSMGRDEDADLRKMADDEREAILSSVVGFRGIV